MAESPVLDLQPDEGLKAQVHSFEDTVSAFDVLATHFGVLKTSDVIDLRVDLANFASMSRKDSPTPWDQPLYDRLVKNLLRCGPALLDAASVPRGEERLRGLLKAANEGRFAAERALDKIRNILTN